MGISMAMMHALSKADIELETGGKIDLISCEGASSEVKDT